MRAPFWDTTRACDRATRAVYYDLVRWLVSSLLVLAQIILVQISAQEKQEKKDAPAPPAPNPTNLKVLKVATGPEIRQIMRTFTAGLGVQCIYCHIQNNFASDENPKKDVARQMIRMVQQINTSFPDGKMRVTCYTCHRGEAEPKTAPEPKPGG